MPLVTPDYKAPRWLAGAQIQTIFAAKVCKKPEVTYRRERWDTPDGDFTDIDWATPEVADPAAPIVVHFTVWREALIATTLWRLCTRRLSTVGADACRFLEVVREN